MHDDRLQILLQRYFDQLLTTEERQELERILLASPQAREQFWESARWNAALRQWGEAEWGRCDAEDLKIVPLPDIPPATRTDTSPTPVAADARRRSDVEIRLL